MNDLPLVAVVGPTGSGKSDLALRIAAELHGEVVNCDSLQIYRHLDIGTAKLPDAERQGIPHHLLDIVNPDAIFTAGEYARVARPVLREIAQRGLVPVIAGGTGFYLTALIDGLFPGPTRNDSLRDRLARREARHPGWLHRLLVRFDPSAAARIPPADVQKLIRAAEVLLSTRRSLTAWFEQKRDALEGFRILKLGLNPPRAALYERLDRRCARMFETGLLDEVRRVYAMGYTPASKALEAHGYRQAVAILAGEMTLEQGIEQACRNTRRYAKRQWTWFRRDAGVQWLDGFGNEESVIADALAHVRRFLGR